MKSITEEKYDQLIKYMVMLDALVGLGMDNWDGYDDALNLLKEING